MPCNFNQRRLAEFVKEGIRAAGGTPMEFNTISISDGVSMGTEGMKAIARQPRGDRRLDRARRPRPPLRRPRLPGRLRQDDPRRGDGARPARPCPGLVLYNGTIYPGTYKGRRNADDRDRVRGDRRLPGRQDHASTSCTRSRTRPAPGAGACGGQYTANTMSTVMEFIGLSPAGLNGIPAEDPAKDAAARRCGELVMDLVRRDVRPVGDRDRRALENGIAAVAATGGSTNGVLHLLAIAHEFGIAARDRRLRDDRRPDADRRRPEAGRPLHGLRHVRRRRRRPGHARAAQARPAPRRRADRRRPDDRGDRGGGARDARPAGRRPDRDAAQADRRADDPARLASPRTAASSSWPATSGGTPRSGPRLRLRDRLLRGRQGPADPPATSS